MCPPNKRLHPAPRLGAGVLTVVIYSVGRGFQIQQSLAARVSREALGNAQYSHSWRTHAMAIHATYAHTNLIARDWEKLSAFYQSVFGCVPVPPERHLSGADLERGTGVPGSDLHGVHLRLPGLGENGPTLEIFTYSRLAEGSTPTVNMPGFGHIAFGVKEVGEARKAVIQAGGGAVGDVVTIELPTGAKVTWCYVHDPEGNIIELLAWNRKSICTCSVA
jgi:catechol 2,3-dioxygenase-like lactoylglutathione lyase family enzyme